MNLHTIGFLINEFIFTVLGLDNIYIIHKCQIFYGKFTGVCLVKYVIRRVVRFKRREGYIIRKRSLFFKKMTDRKIKKTDRIRHS